MVRHPYSTAFTVRFGLPSITGLSQFVFFVAFCATSLFPDDAHAQAKELQYPVDVIANGKGALFIADRNLPGIWKVEADKLSIFFQASKKFRTPLNSIRCLAIDRNGQLLAGDTGTREVYRFDQKGKPKPLTAGGIGMPMGIAVAADGTIFVSDREVEWIWKVPAEGGKPKKFAEVDSPEGIAIDADDHLWVVSHGKDQLLRISPAGKVEPVVKGRPFRYPHHVVFDKQKTAYVSDGYAKTIWKVDSDGKVEKWVGGKPLEHPVGLTWKEKKLWIVDSRAKALFEAGTDGKIKATSLMPEN